MTRNPVIFSFRDSADKFCFFKLFVDIRVELKLAIGNKLVEALQFAIYVNKLIRKLQM